MDKWGNRGSRAWWLSQARSLPPPAHKAWYHASGAPGGGGEPPCRFQAGPPSPPDPPALSFPGETDAHPLG